MDDYFQGADWLWTGKEYIYKVTTYQIDEKQLDDDDAEKYDVYKHECNGIGYLPLGDEEVIRHKSEL
jgi:hypothetical protein